MEPSDPPRNAVVDQRVDATQRFDEVHWARLSLTLGGGLPITSYRKLFSLEKKANGAERERIMRMRIDLRKALVAEHGKILHELPAPNVDGLLVLFQDGTFEVRFGGKKEGCDDAYTLLDWADDLCRRAKLLGPTEESHYFREAIYGAASFVMGELNDHWSEEEVAKRSNTKDASKPKGPDLSLGKTLLDQMETQLREAEARTAKVVYFKGMLAGAAAIPLAVALLARLMQVVLGDGGFPVLLIGVFLAGALGGVLSAMSRLMDDAIRFNWATGRSLLFSFGVCRPLVGALFGVACHLMLVGELLPVKLPEGAAQPYFFLAAALLTGFSERWAKDMLDKSSQKLGGGGEGKGEKKTDKEDDAKASEANGSTATTAAK